MKKPRPTREQIEKHLRYEPRTGELFWLHPTSVRVKAGDPAGYVSPYGYVIVRLLNYSLFRSHIVWFIEKGAWPKLTVDHKSTDKLDDRIKNLRDVPQKWNNQNMRKAQRNNRSGLLGAYWCEKRGKWFSSIKVDSRTVGLGRFPTAEQAHRAYLRAKRKYHEGNTL